MHSSGLHLLEALIEASKDTTSVSLAASLFASVRPRAFGKTGALPGIDSGTAQWFLENSGVVWCAADPGGLVRWISPNAATILGSACDRAAELNLNLTELLQPQDQVEFSESIARMARAEGGNAVEMPVLTRGPSGAERWLEIRWHNRTHDPDEPLWLLEIRDITAAHTSFRFNQILADIIPSASDSVCVTDAYGRILYVNEAWSKATGYDANDVMGLTPSILRSGHHRPDFYDRLWRTVSAGRVFRGEVINRKRDGEYYHEELVITPVADAGGGISYYVSAGRDISERKRADAQAEDKAFFDALTGVANPRLLRERSKQILALARRRGHTAAMLHIDLDGLRSVNDTHGRTLGDEVLRRVADRLRQGLRESDTLARNGSDEFLILLSEVSEEDATARVVRRLRDSICKPFRIHDQTISISASVGVALYPQDATTYDELLEYAQLSVNRARGSRSGVEFFRHELTELTNDRLSLEDDLRWAWERNQFVLHYQPIMALATGSMIGAEALARSEMIGIEALARWPHLERGMIEPAQFIPMAERTGRIVALDRWAISTAVRQAATWQQQGWDGWVSVNLSARSLHDADLPAYITSCTEQHGIDPARLVLEVTESSAMRDVEITMRVLIQLRDIGVRIALDDFGVGHSSLAYLTYFPVDLLKLDQRFIHDIGIDPKFEQLIEVIITLAHRIGAQIVAEGVESEEQYNWLREAGCDYVQGYYVGRPQPPELVRPPGTPAP